MAEEIGNNENNKNQRWYDKDPVLKEALELLRMSAPDDRKEAQEYLLKLQEDTAAEVIERIYEMVTQYSGKGSRWYDNDPIMLRAIELLRTADPKTQRIAALKILQSLERKDS